jgi:hypothetical protein
MALLEKKQRTVAPISGVSGRKSPRAYCLLHFLSMIRVSAGFSQLFSAA